MPRKTSTRKRKVIKKEEEEDEIEVEDVEEKKSTRLKKSKISSKRKKVEEEEEEEHDDEEIESEEEEKIEKEETKKPIVYEYNRNPKSLKDLDYEFNTKGKLVHLKTGEAFKFLEQAHYELIGNLVAEQIQTMLKKDHSLEEVWLPLSPTHPLYLSSYDKDEEEADKQSTKKANNGDKSEKKKEELKVNIFMSMDALTNKNKLLVISCGSGQVQAGQWSRSLCINDSLEVGSILPYLEKAHNLGYGVIVVNPNMTSVTRKKLVPRKEKNAKSNKKQKKDVEMEEVREHITVKHNETPLHHMNYVYDHFVSKAVAKHIVIVAHSFGGVCSTQLLVDRESELFGNSPTPKKLRAIAFTDSVHSYNRGWSRRIRNFLKEHSINWACSKEELDKVLRSKGGCQVRSAGTPVHERASACCIDSVFDFFEEEINAN